MRDQEALLRRVNILAGKLEECCGKPEAERDPHLHVRITNLRTVLSTTAGTLTRYLLPSHELAAAADRIVSLEPEVEELHRAWLEKRDRGLRIA